MDKRAVDSPRPAPETPSSPLDDYEANLRRSAEARSRYQAESAARAAATAKAEAEHAKAVAAVNAQGSPSRLRDAEERYQYSQQALAAQRAAEAEAQPRPGESEYARAKRLNPGPAEAVNPATGFLRAPDMGEYTPRGGSQYAPGGTVHNVLHGAAKFVTSPSAKFLSLPAGLANRVLGGSGGRVDQLTSNAAEGVGRFGGSLVHAFGGVVPTIQHNAQLAAGNALHGATQGLTNNSFLDPIGSLYRRGAEYFQQQGNAPAAAATQVASAVGPGSIASPANVIQQAPQIAPYYLPGIGNWMMGNDAISEYRKGNYGRSTAYGSAAVVPVVGPMAGRALRGLMGPSKALSAAGTAVGHAASLAPIVVPTVGEVAGAAGQPQQPANSAPAAAPPSTPAPQPMAALTPPKPLAPVPTPKKTSLAAMTPKATGLA
jgi:hypothetical protein